MTGVGDMGSRDTIVPEKFVWVKMTPTLGKGRMGPGELGWEACYGRILGSPRLKGCRQHPGETGGGYWPQVKVSNQDKVTRDLGR